MPTPGSAKTRLLQAAMEEFSTFGFEGVNVVELTQRIGITTGTLYHHFGSKVGLYQAIRWELERRIVDRMEGASSVFLHEPKQGISSALLVGFDAAVRMNTVRILSEIPKQAENDFVAQFLSCLCCKEHIHLGNILLASWRASLAMVANGIDPAEARAALQWILPMNERKRGESSRL